MIDSEVMQYVDDLRLDGVVSTLVSALPSPTGAAALAAAAAAAQSDATCKSDNGCNDNGAESAPAEAAVPESTATADVSAEAPVPAAEIIDITDDDPTDAETTTEQPSADLPITTDADGITAADITASLNESAVDTSLSSASDADLPSTLDGFDVDPSEKLFYYCLHIIEANPNAAVNIPTPGVKKRGDKLKDKSGKRGRSTAPTPSNGTDGGGSVVEGGGEEMEGGRSEDGMGLSVSGLSGADLDELDTMMGLDESVVKIENMDATTMVEQLQQPSFEVQVKTEPSDVSLPAANATALADTTDPAGPAQSTTADATVSTSPSTYNRCTVSDRREKEEVQQAQINRQRLQGLQCSQPQQRQGRQQLVVQQEVQEAEEEVVLAPLHLSLLVQRQSQRC